MVVDRTVRYLLQKPHSRRCLERTAAKPRIERQCLPTMEFVVVLRACTDVEDKESGWIFVLDIIAK